MNYNITTRLKEYTIIQRNNAKFSTHHQRQKECDENKLIKKIMFSYYKTIYYQTYKTKKKTKKKNETKNNNNISSHLPPLTLNENLPDLYPLIFDSGNEA